MKDQESVSGSTAPEQWNPGLAAAFAYAGIVTGHPDFVAVAHAAARMIKNIVEKVEQDRRTAVNEFMGRCRHLVETQGVRRVIGRVAYYRYYDHALTIEWQHPTGDPPYETEGVMTVYDRHSGLAAGHQLSTTPATSNLSTKDLQQQIDRLRQDMVLDDIVRATIG